MTAFDFGEYRLDPAGRTLTLRGEMVPIQPLVFDLLAYLVGNAGRVIPKDELMDALWPDITVTEASLQRAVSLARAALRPGGYDGAIRNLIRHGYRFALDLPSIAEISPEEPTKCDLCHEARRAAAERRWAAAAELFARADEDAPLGPVDLDLWGYVLECVSRRKEALQAYGRAIEGHIGAGDAGAAAQSASRLSDLNLGMGQPHVGAGWLSRAEELLGDEPSPTPAACVYLVKSKFAAFAGRADEAFELASRANDYAEESPSAAVRALVATYQGLYSITLGRLGDGQRRQDRAAAIALSSEVDPLTGSLIYCSILWTCRTFADWSRANQWNPGFEIWTKAAFAEISGSCRLHKGEVLGAVGRLSEGLLEIDASIKQLEEEGTWELGDAYRVRGDLHAWLGDADQARRDYERAIGASWDAEPGLAQLRAAQGDPKNAIAALDRSCLGQSWYSVQRRAWLLANKAQIAANALMESEARAALEALRHEREMEQIPATRAMAMEAEARLAAAHGDFSEALRSLYAAIKLWSGIRHEYHVARVRLWLADLLDMAGDAAGAQLERAAAIAVAKRIAAKSLLSSSAMPLAPKEHSVAVNQDVLTINDPVVNGRASSAPESAVR